jgi:GNAT superfamily N-acetyltransferase
MFPVFPEFYARIEKFFQSDHPGTSMARSVLANRCPGTVFVDHPMNPTTALVAVDNSFLIGGRDLNRTFLERVINRLRQNRALHRTPEWLPGGYTNTIQRKEFRNRDGSIRSHLPELSDIRVCKVTSDLLPRCQWTHEMERIFGGLHRFFLHGLGFCLVRGEDILAEAYAAFWGGGPVEIAVVTDRHHRRRGLGLRVCLELIEACEAMGFETCWNCDARNRASIGLANRLSYRSSTDYTLFEYPAMRIENRRENVIG